MIEMGLSSIAPWRRKKVEPKPEAKAEPGATDDQPADDYFEGWTPYEREREEARFRVIADSMERALGHGKGSRNPPVQETYSPFDW